jgi:uncharacterized protein
MSDSSRIVLDTNVWISALLREKSPPWRVVHHALSFGEIIATADTLAEVAEVLLRPKFNRYLSRARREAALRDLAEFVTVVAVRERLRVCPDPKDDIFLEAVVAGEAGLLVTGDRHLLRLGCFRGADIVTPSEYLRRAAGRG